MNQIIRRSILALALIAGFSPAIAQVPPPVPALPDTPRQTTYSLSGSTCVCAVNFALYGDSTDYTNWLEVFLNGVLMPQIGNWTITSPTGSLATIPRPITDAVLTFTTAQTGTVQIVGARRPRRTSQYNEGNGVPTRNFNRDLSDIIAMLRENWDKTNDVSGRAVLARPGETLALLPVLASRANMGACFDSGGNLTSCVAASSGSFAAGAGITFTGTNPTTISLSTATRIPLTANTTFYANASLGSDVAGCGLAQFAAACKNPQTIVNFLTASYDLRGFSVTIQLANSTSPAYQPVTVSGKWTGGNQVTLQGNTASPSSVLIDGAGGGTCVLATQGGILTVQGFTVQNCALELASDIAGGQLYFQQINFGAPTAGGTSIYCSRQSYCEIAGGGNIISGLGGNFIQASHQGNFRSAFSNTGATPFTLASSLTLAVGGTFALSSSGGDITFTGYSSSAFSQGAFSVTGSQWHADSNGLFQILNASTGGSLTPTFFPGSNAGNCAGDCSIDQASHAGPTVTSCGTSAVAAGYDFYGQVVEGNATTGCVVHFASAFSSAPFCTISFNSFGPTSLSYSTSTTGITLSHATTSGQGAFYFICKGD